MNIVCSSIIWRTIIIINIVIFFELKWKSDYSDPRVKIILNIVKISGTKLLRAKALVLPTWRFVGGGRRFSTGNPENFYL